MYISYLIYESLDLDRSAAFLLAAFASILTSSVCYGVHICRVVLVIFFSISWGYFAFTLTDLMPGTSINRWAAFAAISILLLILHRPVLRKKMFAGPGV